MKVLAVALVVLLAGCEDAIVTFGRPGLGDGEFREPRSVTASEHGVAVVDRSGRLQLFDLDGVFKSKFAVAPDNVRRGLPCGVTWLADGTLALADTHQGYLRVLSTDGRTLQHLGGFGAEPGQFNMPQRVAELGGTRFAVTDFGTGLCNRVQIVSLDTGFERMFGGPEDENGGLERPMGIVPRDDGSFVLADQRAGLVVFDAQGRFAGPFGGTPAAPGTLLYGLCRTPDGTYFASDIGHDRLLRVSEDGTPTGTFGRSGSEPGEFLEPWDVSFARGRLYVADKGNHRVQRIDPSRIEWVKP